jgi:excisionase family DNA binding protein
VSANLDPLYDVPGAAAYMGIKAGTMRNWLSERRLSHVKVGRLTKVRKSELDRYLAEHTVAAVDQEDRS